MDVPYCLLCKQKFLTIASQFLLIGTLYAFPPIEMGWLSFLIVLALLTIFIFNFKSPLNLFVRQSIVNNSLKEGSNYRSLSNPSIFTKIGHYFLSLVGALIILMTVDNLSGIDWLVLMASVISFHLVFFWVSRKVSNNFEEKPKLILKLKLASIINFLFIVITFTFVQYTSTHPLLADKDFIDTVVQTWESKTSNNNPIAYILAIDDVVNATQFWILQAYLTSENTSFILKLLGWLFFFIANAISLAFLWGAFLGIHYSIEKQEEQKWRLFGKTQFSIAFWITLFVFSIFSLLFKDGINAQKMNYNTYSLTFPSDQLDAQNSSSHQEEKCSSQEISADLTKLQYRINAIQAEAIKAYVQRSNAETERILNKAFQPIDQGIENFLDWRYSVSTEYAVIAKYLVSKVSGGNEVSEYIEEKINHFIYDPLQKSLDEQIPRLEIQRKLALAEISAKIKEEVSSQLPDFETSCLRDSLPNVQKAIDVQTNTVGLGSVGGGAAALAFKPASKVIASKASQIALKFTAKIVTKAAMSGAAASSGVVCGPFTVICGIGAVAGTWLAVDKAVVESDEALNRENRKNELLTVYQQVKFEYLKSQRIQIQQDAESIKKTFSPIKDIQW